MVVVVEKEAIVMTNPGRRLYIYTAVVQFFTQKIRQLQKPYRVNSYSSWYFEPYKIPVLARVTTFNQLLLQQQQHVKLR